jgi:hypothetical protein
MIASAGWDGLVTSVISAAREAVPDAAAVLDRMLSMDGRIPVEQGLGRLARESRALVPLCRTPLFRADVQPVARDTNGGAVSIAPDGRPFLVAAPPEATLVATIQASTDDGARALTDALTRWKAERENVLAERALLHGLLASRDPVELNSWIDSLERVLTHMAPLMVQVGDTCFTNLGRGNLPGRSVGVEDPANLMQRLRSTTVASWTEDEAAFLAICRILMASGPQSRLEEANGLCLDLEWVHSFLTARAQSYGMSEPAPTDRADFQALLDFGAGIARRRQELLLGGHVFYREIHGVSLNKEEKVLPRVPDVDNLARLSHTWALWPALPATTADMGRGLADRVRDAVVSERAAARAAALREVLFEAAEATGSDVAMSRGPRDLFFVEDLQSRNPLELRTNDFYCCVVPSADFAERHRGQQPPLEQILSAYSARMRFNSWHYLPHVLDLTDQERDDWFFAPTMPDLTHHSEWHHTGHVKFGVRYAIRVPIRAKLGGSDFPGLYDLRLMRVTGDPYTVDDLAAAVALGSVIRAFHEQVYSFCRSKVTEFDNAWFRSSYAD